MEKYHNRRWPFTGGLTDVRRNHCSAHSTKLSHLACRAIGELLPLRGQALARKGINPTDGKGNGNGASHKVSILAGAAQNKSGM